MASFDTKIGGRERAEVRRRADLIAATIIEIGVVGSLDVTVGKIAKRAGISPALAFHYFGDKTSLFLAAMRHLMTSYRREIGERLRAADGPRARAEAVARASFSPQNFSRGSVAAWLNFYVLAQSSPEARRLLAIYHSRLNSNLRHALRPLLGDEATGVADRIGSLIDGLYLRAALGDRTDADEAERKILNAIEHDLRGAN